MSQQTESQSQQMHKCQVCSKDFKEWEQSDDVSSCGFFPVTLMTDTCLECHKAKEENQHQQMYKCQVCSKDFQEWQYYQNEMVCGFTRMTEVCQDCNKKEVV